MEAAKVVRTIYFDAERTQPWHVKGKDGQRVSIKVPQVIQQWVIRHVGVTKAILKVWPDQTVELYSSPDLEADSTEKLATFGTECHTHFAMFPVFRVAQLGINGRELRVVCVHAESHFQAIALSGIITLQEVQLNRYRVDQVAS